MAGAGDGAAFLGRDREFRFYRSARARALPGSGLGLAIVRRIADMHDGTVEAIPLKQGVKFRISVPRIVVDQPTAERTPARS
jgi:signal transduction histidine kinase